MVCHLQWVCCNWEQVKLYGSAQSSFFHWREWHGALVLGWGPAGSREMHLFILVSQRGWEGKVWAWPEDLQGDPPSHKGLLQALTALELCKLEELSGRTSRSAGGLSYALAEVCTYAGPAAKDWEHVQYLRVTHHTWDVTIIVGITLYYSKIISKYRLRNYFPRHLQFSSLSGT